MEFVARGHKCLSRDVGDCLCDLDVKALRGIEPGSDRSPAERQLKITIPENLDYDGLFDDLLNEYTLEHELIRVRTTNMGTLYELTYNIRLRGKDISKDFIDALRCRNGNLTVSCGREADRDMM